MEKETNKSEHGSNVRYPWHANALLLAIITSPLSDGQCTCDLEAIRVVLETVLDERLAGNLLPIAEQRAHDPEMDAKLDEMLVSEHWRAQRRRLTPLPSWDTAYQPPEQFGLPGCVCR